MAEIAVGLALGLVVGLTLSMMGAGGSIITVPALVFITDLPVHEATGTALLVVVGLAVVGGVSHYRRGATMPKMAAAVGLSGIGGSIAGAWLNQRADEDLILLFLALLMIVAGARMLQGAVGRGGETDGELAARPASSRLVLGAAAGSVLGLLTGFFGLGGGFLIVPPPGRRAGAPDAARRRHVVAGDLDARRGGPDRTSQLRECRLRGRRAVSWRRPGRGRRRQPFQRTDS